MKKTFLFIFSILALSVVAQAQNESFSRNLSLGFHLSQNQQDFGLGVDVTSPYFANRTIAVRARGNLMWYQHLLEGEVTWTPYSNASLGLVAVGGEVGGFLRLYGEGGIMLLFPSDDFSSESSNIGGYGLFGFEFFMARQYSYYLEVGGLGTGATADRLPGNPIHSNGLMINVGFRYTLSD